MRRIIREEEVIVEKANIPEVYLLRIEGVEFLVETAALEKIHDNIHRERSWDYE